MENRIYRGKEFQTDKWIYGSLLVGSHDCFICWEVSINHFQTFKVNSYTVGVCTGYIDTVGNMLFEGDIITSFYGFEYLIVLTRKGIKAESKQGFLYDLDLINKPLKKSTIHDGKEK